jgi:hypothetical protein
MKRKYPFEDKKKHKKKRKRKEDKKKVLKQIQKDEEFARKLQIQFYQGFNIEKVEENVKNEEKNIEEEGEVEHHPMRVENLLNDVSSPTHITITRVFTTGDGKTTTTRIARTIVGNNQTSDNTIIYDESEDGNVEQSSGRRRHSFNMDLFRPFLFNISNSLNLINIDNFSYDELLDRFPNKSSWVGASEKQIKKNSSEFKINKDTKKDSCRICLCDYKEEDVCRRLQCKHTYHKKCIDKWLIKNAICPLCKQPLSWKDS